MLVKQFGGLENCFLNEKKNKHWLIENRAVAGGFSSLKYGRSSVFRVEHVKPLPSACNRKKYRLNDNSNRALYLNYKSNRIVQKRNGTYVY